MRRSTALLRLCTGLLALGLLVPSPTRGQETPDPRARARQELERVRRGEELVRAERSAVLLGELIEERGRGGRP